MSNGRPRAARGSGRVAGKWEIAQEGIRKRGGYLERHVFRRKFAACELTVLRVGATLIGRYLNLVAIANSRARGKEISQGSVPGCASQIPKKTNVLRPLLEMAAALALSHEAGRVESASNWVVLLMHTDIADETKDGPNWRASRSRGTRDRRCAVSIHHGGYRIR